MRHAWIRCSKDKDALAGIFIRSNISHQLLPLPTPSDRVLAISLNTKIGEMVIIACYIQHTSGAGLEALDSAIRMAKSRTSLVLVGGDLNGHSPLWGDQNTNPLGAQIEDLIGALGLIVLNTPDSIATFQNSRGHSSWIDVTLGTQHLAELLEAHAVLPDALPSDHNLLRTKLNLESKHIPTRGVWNWDQTDWPTFAVRLEERIPNWLKTQNLDCPKLIEEGVTLLSKAIRQTRSELVSYRHLRSKPKPWFTPAVRIQHRALRKAKSALHKAQRRAGNGQAPPQVATTYKQARLKFEVAVKTAKEQCFMDFCKQIHPQMDMWDKFRQICGTRRIESVPALSTDGQMVSDPEDKADLLLHTFFPGATSTPPGTPEVSPQWDRSIFTSPEELITSQEVQDTISYARRTAPGSDEIPVICWQACSSFLVPILQRIYNACLQCNYYPSQWRHAQVLPLPKGTKNRSNPSSWRPISLLCNAGKFMEKIIQRRLSLFLERTRALSEAQHGFRRNHSTESALLVLAEDTTRAFNRRKQIAAVSLDISKAFDSVSHSLLLQRMSDLATPQYITKFLCSFLTQRSATLTLDGASRCVTVPRGVPQGSSLSPTIFSIYMDTLAHVIRPPVRLLMYADDCLLYQEIGREQTDCAPLQTALAQTTHWGVTWSLSFNPTKSQLCRFSRLRRTNPVELHQGPHLLREQPVIRYLGLDIDTAWTFIGHLKNKKIICQRRLAQIRRLSHSHWGSSPWVTKKLMDACILPVCLYGSSIYDPLSRGRSSRLQILRSIYRTGGIYITGAHRTTPTCSVLQLAGLHPPEVDILDRLTNSKHLWHSPTNSAESKPRYISPAEHHATTFTRIAAQDWISENVQRLLRENIEQGKRSQLVQATRKAYLTTLVCDIWKTDSKGQALKKTGWSTTSSLEQSWLKQFSRPSVTRLARFLSGHFPMKTYLARFHCLEESTSLCCRFGCEQEETREHLLSCPQLTNLRKKTIGSEKFPQTLSLNYLWQLDNFLAVSKIT